MIAILADIHANLAALDAVLDDARARGSTRFLSLGDVAGYHAQPGECIDRLREIGAVNLMGNHDSYLVSEQNCPRSRVVAGIIDVQKKLVSAEQIEWLRGSPASLREGSTLYVHGGPEDPQDQYLYAVRESTIPADVQCLFSGHTHVQALIEFGPKDHPKIFCNPGSVGQPRDNDPRAAYATVDEAGRIHLHRVRYDIDSTAQAMKAAGFEPFHYENLYIGAQIGGRIDRIKVLEKDEEA